MKIGIVVFPGSNCDMDLFNALSLIDDVSAIKLWHNESGLQGCEFIMLPGGFSYGDYLRAGALSKHSKIMQEIIKFAGKGGPVLGICNGFQILCEAKLLPGSLITNKNGKFICDKSPVKLVSNKRPFNNIDKNKVFELCIAHAEGNYYADEDTIKLLEDNDEIIFKYCNHEGEIDASANPNGSINNISGICNKMRNVIALMPHPERAMDKNIHGSCDGKELLETIIKGFK
ncbi:MAG: phosphoribosylformylglycinamidine synthase subunit PurQ [Solitalea-like symbiont of Acarus siro]